MSDKSNYYKYKSKYTKLKNKQNNENKMKQEYKRWTYVQKIKELVNDDNKKMQYEYLNSLDELFINMANTKPEDHVFIKDSKNNKSTTWIWDQFSKRLKNNKIHDKTNIVKQIINDYFKDDSNIKINCGSSPTKNGVNYYCNNFKYDLPRFRSNALLQRGTVEDIIIMILRYECIVWRGNHWNDPLSFHKYIYEKENVRLEGFSSPLNSQLMLLGTDINFCSLFPDTDSVFGSIGSFFDITDEPESISFDPPHSESLINNGIKKTLGWKKTRVYYNLPNWTDMEGYDLLDNRIGKDVNKRLFETGEFYYEHMGKTIMFCGKHVMYTLRGINPEGVFNSMVPPQHVFKRHYKGIQRCLDPQKMVHVKLNNDMIDLESMFKDNKNYLNYDIVNKNFNVQGFNKLFFHEKMFLDPFEFKFVKNKDNNVINLNNKIKQIWKNDKLEIINRSKNIEELKTNIIGKFDGLYLTHYNAIINILFSNGKNKSIYVSNFDNDDLVNVDLGKNIKINNKNKSNKSDIIFTHNFDINYHDKLWDLLEIGGYIAVYPSKIDYKTFNNIKSLISHNNKKMNGLFMGMIGLETVYNRNLAKPVWIWKKINKIQMDSELYIEKVKHNNKNFNVIQDGIMPGGSKQRMYTAFKNVKENELVYAGPPSGLAQVALGIIGKYYNKSATMFSYSTTYLTARAMQYGVKMIIHKKKLKDLQDIASSYSKYNKAYLCPFGFDSPELRKALTDNIIQNNVDKVKPKHIWSVVGSATLINSLYGAFSNSKFSIVQVGKKVWPDQYNQSNTKLYISDIPFREQAKILPPYESIPEYDAKVWEFVIKYGKDGDYIWNVGSKSIINK